MWKVLQPKQLKNSQDLQMTINTKGVVYMGKQRKQEISGKSTPDKASISEISRILNNSLEDHDDKEQP